MGQVFFERVIKLTDENFKSFYVAAKNSNWIEMHLIGGYFSTPKVLVHEKILAQFSRAPNT